MTAQTEEKPKKEEKPKGLLPTTKSPASVSLKTAKTMLYGPPKIGKTTLAANLYPEETLILATEPGTGGIEAFEIPVRSWEEFRAIGAELADPKKHKFKTIVVDTTDELFRFCQEAVQIKHNIRHPSELDFGKGWQLLSDEFRLRVGKLAGLGYGVVFISHSKDTEVELRVGSTTKWVPTLSGQAGKFLTGFVDNILYMTKEGTGDGEELVLRTRSSQNWDAGTRGIVLPDPLVLPMDAENPGLAAAALREAFGEGS